MTVSQNPESSSFIDPFWLEHREQIWQMRKAFEAPKTRVGEERLSDALNNPVLMVYHQLGPIFGSLVALLEYDEISKKEGKGYFSEPINQRMALKAFGVLVEDKIKIPCSPEEKKQYGDYRAFFEGVLTRFHQLETQIQAGGRLPNFVNSLVMTVSGESTKLKGVENFRINTEGIREKIARYLPELEKIGEGRILSEIKKQMTSALVSQAQKT